MKDLTKHESLHVLKTNYIGYLSFLWQNKPFVIPITYYYNEKDHCIISYSAEGHKMDAMRINKSVALGITEINAANCWQSVLIHGEFEEFVGTHAKQQLHKFADGVKKILFTKENESPNLISDFSSRIPSRNIPIVYCIKVTKMTGKYRKY